MLLKKEIIAYTQNGFGVLTLNRPQALNALSLNMLLEMGKQLDKWEKDPLIHTVLIKSDDDRAFCAGGDVKLVAEEMQKMRLGGKQSTLVRDFFRIEYSLDAQIAFFSKPYISFLNGVVMGGGNGISLHGSHRVVTDNVKFAMPETKIGFFPDVGCGAVLASCPGYTGLYLAMTGSIISGEDMCALGLATHFVSKKDKENIFELVLASENADDVLSCYKTETGGFENQDKINIYFNKSSVEEIFLSLEKDKEQDSWCATTYEALSSRCPTSLKVSFKHFHLSRKTVNLVDIFKMDYRLSQNMTMRSDFYEGVRAVLIDKTGNAGWLPPSIHEVKDEDVEVFFGSCLNGEEDLVVSS